MGAIGRFLDLLFAVFFLLCIFVTVFMDSQMILPRKHFPAWAQNLTDWYAETYRDPNVSAAPLWMKTFVAIEVFVQLPFFFLFAFAFFKGGCRWVRTPVIIYATNTATMVLTILVHVMLYDFNKDPKHHGPRNREERLVLLSAYAPFFIFPVIILLRMLFDRAYSSKVKSD